MANFFNNIRAAWQWVWNGDVFALDTLVSGDNSRTFNEKAATIELRANGKYALCDAWGNTIKEYTRRNGAVKGAERLGLELQSEDEAVAA